MLEIACSRCDRKRGLRLDRLIEKHGADQGMPDLREIIAADGIHDRCGVHYPQLPALFPAAAQSRR